MGLDRLLSWLVLCAVLGGLGVDSQGGLGRCHQEDQSYQILSGFVFTDTGSIISTETGVFDIVSCLSRCKSSTACLSVNYETGLCVLFSSSATTMPEHLSSSQLPVWTIYAEKICVPTVSATPCQTSWTFEMVPKSYLNATLLTVAVRDLAECRTKCRDEDRFVCRSVNYNTTSSRCGLAGEDRSTVRGGGELVSAEEMVYLENNCAPGREVGVCEYKPRLGVLLKTVDSVFNGVETIQECQSLCKNLTEYRCISYDWAHTGPGVCRLSHHNPSTLSHVTQPYLRVKSAATYQLHNCYNLSVTCHHHHMLATVTSNNLFSGKIYTKTRPNSCLVDVERKREFSLSIGYNDLACDAEINKESGRVGAEIILQHHDKIITSGDIGIYISCQYNMNTSVVYQAMELGDELHNQGFAEELMLRSPDIRMRITDQKGQDITTAMVGDPLAIRFEILDTDTPYDMFVRELVAMDGTDSSNILLIDTLGCPTDTTIVQTIQTISESPKTLQANFDAFKFAGSSVVQFRAMVTPCVPNCQPIVCSHSVRRRRRRSVSNTTSQESSPVILAHQLTIVERGEEVEEVETRSCSYRTEYSLTVYTVCVVFSVLLLCQCLVIILCVKLRKRNVSQQSPL